MCKTCKVDYSTSIPFFDYETGFRVRRGFCENGHEVLIDTQTDRWVKHNKEVIIDQDTLQDEMEKAFGEGDESNE